MVLAPENSDEVVIVGRELLHGSNDSSCVSAVMVLVAMVTTVSHVDHGRLHDSSLDLCTALCAVLGNSDSELHKQSSALGKH